MSYHLGKLVYASPDRQYDPGDNRSQSGPGQHLSISCHRRENDIHLNETIAPTFVASTGNY